MKIVALLSALALLCTQDGLASGSNQPKRYLRNKSDGQFNVVRNHRFLTTSDSVPFTVAVNIGKGSDKMDLEPTEADYNAVTSSIMSWFDAESQGYYANATDFRYVATTCEIKDEGAPPGFYNISAEDYDDRFQYQLSLTCHAKFNSLQPQNEPSNIPSPLDLVSDALGSYSMAGFIPDHFAPAMPLDGAFDHVRHVALILRYSFVTTAAPVDSDPVSMNETDTIPITSSPMVPSTSAPGAPASTVAPAPAIAPASVAPDTTLMPHSTNPFPGGSATEGSGVNIPMVLEWTLGAPNLEELRAPTEEEYTDLIVVIQNFVKDSMEKTFNLDDESEQLADFVNIELTTVRSKTYDATSSDKPYVIVVETLASFRETPGTTAPRMWQWVGALRIAGLTVFRNDYLAKTSGIFQNPSSIQWRALDA